MSRVYACIDLKSFYASVECAARGLDPFTTNLVVADPERSRTTICLAITPAMKDLGVKNRCRVFDIPENIDYIMAKPRMKTYMQKSAEIVSVYLRYISAEDIHVYSIDEVFMDLTPYVSLYGKTPKELAVMLMDAVFQETGICATAGIGTNMFLAKVALDITAKHVDDHIGYLDEDLFKEQIWDYQPITDIWNVGPGIARRLAKYAVYTMRGVTEMNPDTLYREFGAPAEYLIDHAWGQEPCTIADIHAYEPEGSSMTNGQVLPADYTFEEARMVLAEMIDASVLEMIERGVVCGRIHLGVGYAKEAAAAGSPREILFEGEHGKRYAGGRMGWGHTGGSRKLVNRTNSRKRLLEQILAFYDETTDHNRMIRRINVGFADLLPEECATLDLFADEFQDKKERQLQEAVLAVRQKFGKNSMLKAMSLQEKATARERNQQVGGHHA